MLLGGLEIPLWLLLGVPVVTLLYYYSTRTFGAFKDSGIPGPKPWPLIGTMMDMYKHGSMFANDMAYRKEYGKFVATFEGSTPVMLVMDAEFLKEAWIKNFAKFTNRRAFRLGGSLDDGLFSAEGAHWKYIRQRLSPEFSSGKLKKMLPSIAKCDEIFVSILRKSEGKPVDIRKRVFNLTLDVISATAFGIDVEAQTKEENNPFSYNANKLVGSFANDGQTAWLEQMRGNLVILMTLFLPDWCLKLIHKFFNMGLLDSNANAYFDSLSESLIKERKNATGNDFIQTLANNLIDDPSSDPDAQTNHNGNLWTQKGFTNIEIKGNTLTFLTAGFQTTADTMLYVFYELAHNPGAQQKLYEDIVSVCDTDEVTIEQVNQLKYMEYVINEAMRLYPQGFRFDRVAAEDVEIQGIKITKGTAVTASGWVIQRDPEYFEDPEDFKPERFAPENFTEKQSAAFIPFGIGNRICIGNRLALLEMKTTFITVLKNFTIEKNEETPERPLKFAAGINLTPVKPIMVSFVPRY